MAVLNGSIQIWSQATAGWSADPVLLAGQFGHDSTTNELGIGDGSTAWSALPKFTTSPSSYTADEDTLQLVGNEFSVRDAELLALAGLASAANTLPYFTGSGTAALADLSAAGRALIDDADASAQLTTLGLSANGKSLVTAADYAAMRALLDLEVGTDLQGYDAELAAIAALTSAANKVPRFTGSGSADLLDFDTDGALAADSATRIPSQSAVKAYVDSLVNGVDWKEHARAATTANITLSGAQTIDGVSVIAGERVLVKNQSAPAENGIYVCASGAWSRSTDADSGNDLELSIVKVREGTANGLKEYRCSTYGITLGSTAITWLEWSSGTTYAADETTLTLSANTFSVKNAGVGTTQIADGNVTLAKLADMATASLLGRNTGGTGVPEVLSASTVRALLDLEIGTDVQAYDAELAAIAALTSAADKGIQFTGSGTAGTFDLTAAGKALLDDADATAQRATLGLVIGTNVQAQDAELAAIAGLTSAADKLPYFTGSGTAALVDFTAAGRALVDDADASAQRTTLGLGTAALLNEVTVTVGSGQTTTSATPVDLTSINTSLVASARYAVDVYVLAESASTSTGVGLTINGSTAATYFAARMEGHQSAGNFALTTITAYDAGTAAATVAIANTPYLYKLSAIVENGGSASTLSARIFRGGSSNTITVRAAFMKVRRLA